MRQTRILITGVLGFIGSQFSRMLLEETNWHVIGFDRDSHQDKALRIRDFEKDSCFRIVHGDLTDPSAMSGICEDLDYVVHFAAKTFVDHSILDPRPFMDSNIGGTYNLLEQVRKYGIKKYIQVSTDEVYGAISDGAYTEEARLKPSNPYSATKAAGDMLALAYANTYKLPIVVTRTENNYGPMQHRQKVLPTFVRKALAGEKLPVYGDGQHKRMWLHVTDHCSALYQLLDKGRPGEVYHIAGEQELANLELAKIVLRSLSLPEDQIEFIPDEKIRPGHDRRYALDTTKIRTELGWKPLVSLTEGLQATVEWYAQNPWWTQ